eukprot:Rmarinus@m.2979
MEVREWNDCHRCKAKWEGKVQDLEGRIRNMEEVLSHTNARALEHRLQDLTDQISEKDRELAALKARHTKEIIRLREENEELVKETAQRARVVNRETDSLKLRISTAESKRAAAESKLVEVLEARAQAEEALSLALKKVDEQKDLRGTIANLEAQLRSATAQKDEAVRAHEEKQKECRALQFSVKKAEKATQDTKKILLESQKFVETTKTGLTQRGECVVRDVLRQKERAEKERSKAQKDAASARDELQTLEAKFHDTDSALKQASDENKSLQGKLEQAIRRQQAEELRVRTLQVTVREQQARVTALEAERSQLEKRRQHPVSEGNTRKGVGDGCGSGGGDDGATESTSNHGIQGCKDSTPCSRLGSSGPLQSPLSPRTPTRAPVGTLSTGAANTGPISESSPVSTPQQSKSTSLSPEETIELYRNKLRDARCRYQALQLERDLLSDQKESFEKRVEEITKAQNEAEEERTRVEARLAQAHEENGEFLKQIEDLKRTIDAEREEVKRKLADRDSSISALHDRLDAEEEGHEAIVEQLRAAHSRVAKSLAEETARRSEMLGKIKEDTERRAATLRHIREEAAGRAATIEMLRASLGEQGQEKERRISALEELIAHLWAQVALEQDVYRAFLKACRCRCRGPSEATPARKNPLYAYLDDSEDEDVVDMWWKDAENLRDRALRQAESLREKEKLLSQAPTREPVAVNHPHGSDETTTDDNLALSDLSLSMMSVSDAVSQSQPQPQPLPRPSLSQSVVPEASREISSPGDIRGFNSAGSRRMSPSSSGEEGTLPSPINRAVSVFLTDCGLPSSLAEPPPPRDSVLVSRTEERPLSPSPEPDDQSGCVQLTPSSEPQSSPRIHRPRSLSPRNRSHVASTTRTKQGHRTTKTISGHESHEKGTGECRQEDLSHFCESLAAFSTFLPSDSQSDTKPGLHDRVSPIQASMTDSRTSPRDGHVNFPPVSPSTSSEEHDVSSPTEHEVPQLPKVHDSEPPPNHHLSATSVESSPDPHAPAPIQNDCVSHDAVSNASDQDISATPSGKPLTPIVGHTSPPSPFHALTFSSTPVVSSPQSEEVS